MIRPYLIAVALFSAFVVVSTTDYAEALVQDAIRKDPPKVLAYTIKQDSPGLERVVLTCPIETGCKQAPAKKRRKEIR